MFVAVAANNQLFLGLNFSRAHLLSLVDCFYLPFALSMCVSVFVYVFVYVCARFVCVLTCVGSCIHSSASHAHHTSLFGKHSSTLVAASCVCVLLVVECANLSPDLRLTRSTDCCCCWTKRGEKARALIKYARMQKQRNKHRPTAAGAQSLARKHRLCPVEYISSIHLSQLSLLFELT